jgi:hypothetical protein
MAHLGRWCFPSDVRYLDNTGRSLCFSGAVNNDQPESVGIQFHSLRHELSFSYRHPFFVFGYGAFGRHSGAFRLRE